MWQVGRGKRGERTSKNQVQGFRASPLRMRTWNDQGQRTQKWYFLLILLPLNPPCVHGYFCFSGTSIWSPSAKHGLVLIVKHSALVRLLPPCSLNLEPMRVPSLAAVAGPGASCLDCLLAKDISSVQWTWLHLLGKLFKVTELVACVSRALNILTLHDFCACQIPWKRIQKVQYFL